MGGKRIVKSANENQDENQFEIDEKIVDEVSNAEEFANDDISHEDVMDAVQAIEALAETVIEKANVEEKEINADELLDEVRDLIDSEVTSEETTEDEELPEELMNSAVRVMVSEDGAVELETTPDQVYDTDVDGLGCTMLDTCENFDDLDVEETGDPETDDLLVIGNSKTKNYRKGFIVLKSSTNKRCWSAAVKKVKKMIGSNKMTAAHWAIVSALAKKEEENEKLKKKIECKLIKVLRSNKKFMKSSLIKSNDEFDTAGQPESETKPNETAGKDNPGFEEDGDPTKQTSPETIDSTAGNPTEDPKKQNDTEGDIILPDGESVVIEAPLTNGAKKKLLLKKVINNSKFNCNLYKVVLSSKECEEFHGTVIKCGKIAYAFKNTGAGLIACAAKYVDTGVGNYKPILSDNKIVIGRGKEYSSIFNNAEKLIIANRIASARELGRLQGKKEEILNSKNKEAPKNPISSSAHRGPVNNPKITPVKSNLTPAERQKRLQEIKSAHDARIALQSSKQREFELRKKYEQEERERLFQNSQREINKEKTLLKNNNARNVETLNKIYRGMF